MSAVTRPLRRGSAAWCSVVGGPRARSTRHGGDGEPVDEVVHRVARVALDPRIVSIPSPAPVPSSTNGFHRSRWRPAASCELRHRSLPLHVPLVAEAVDDVGRVADDARPAPPRCRRRARIASSAARISIRWLVVRARRRGRAARRRAPRPTPSRPDRGSRAGTVGVHHHRLAVRHGVRPVAGRGRARRGSAPRRGTSSVDALGGLRCQVDAVGPRVVVGRARCVDPPGQVDHPHGRVGRRRARRTAS